MPLTWLSSKTTIPHATLQTVERERLFELLSNNSTGKLTILRAPAGYGKTTLLSQWFNQCNEPIAWLSIDPVDNDPIRFWKYLIHALSTTVSDEFESRLFPLFNGQFSIELLIDSLLNEIDLIKGRIHIVIDDYHLIKDESIHEMISRFIEYLPNHAHLYLTSRIELPLKMAKWRVKSWITEIGVEQLRFTYDEVERFYTKRKISYDTTEAIQHVYEMTEGWAAGIQMVGLSGGVSTTSEWHVNLLDRAHPFITEFLLQEILASLPSSTSDFLVRTSILNQLEPVACDALTNRTDSYQVLLELEKSGLFIIRLHAKEHIYRYHHLFADALKIELKNRYSHDTISSIYKETTKFLHEEGDFISAIELALVGQLYKVADEWITLHIVDIFISGQATTFMRWVKQLQNADYPVNIETLVMNVITFAMNHELEEAIKLINELECKHEFDQWMDSAEYKGMASILKTITAFVFFASGDHIDQAKEIIENQLMEGRTSSKWDNIPMQYNRLEPQILRTSIGCRGKLWPKEKLIPFLDLFRNTEFKDQNMTGFGYGAQAETLYEKNELDESLIELEQALRYGHRFKDLGLIIPMYILKGRIFAAKKQFVEVYAILDYALETTKELHWLGTLRVMKAHCYLIEGKVSNAERELNKSTHLNSQKAESGQEFWLLVHARILLAKRQTEDALKTCVRVLEKARHERQISTMIEAGLLKAICQMELGNKEIALMGLHEALELGMKYGYVRVFIDEEASRPLLKKYLNMREKDITTHWCSVSVSYVEGLIPDKKIKGNAYDSLTPREQDVLKLLTSGASNIEIANLLFLTEGTVRIYLSKIYSKLGVNSRTQAVLKAQE